MTTHQLHINHGSLYMLDNKIYRCISFNGSLGWFHLLNADGTDFMKHEYNSFGEQIGVEDHGKRIIYQRISELKEVNTFHNPEFKGQLSLNF